MLIRVSVSIVVYIPSLTEDMKFLTVHDSSSKLLYSFLMNYEASLPAFKTIILSLKLLQWHLNFIFSVMNFCGLVDKLFCNWHAAKEPDLGFFET
jgi:hypothetical protein